MSPVENLIYLLNFQASYSVILSLSCLVCPKYGLGTKLIACKWKVVECLANITFTIGYLGFIILQSYINTFERQGTHTEEHTQAIVWNVSLSAILIFSQLFVWSSFVYCCCQK